MKKTCTHCKQEKSLEDFSKVSKSSDKYRSHCKKCRSEIILSRVQERRQENYEAWYLQGNPKIGFCECGDYFIKRKLPYTNKGEDICLQCHQKAFNQAVYSTRPFKQIL